MAQCQRIYKTRTGLLNKLAVAMSTASSKAGPKARLDVLRRQMKEFNLNAYIVPTADRHQSEYISKSDAHREWLTGFTGSAGTALVTETKAFLWTDGRYTLQAKQELDSEFWDLMDESITNTPNRPDYLAENFRDQSASVGVSASCVTNTDFTKLSKTLKRSNINLVAVEKELVTIARTELNEEPPSLPCNPIRALSVEYTGKTVEAKLEEIRSKMNRKGASALVVSALDSVAWLLNCRGSDIQYNPVFYAYLYITKDYIVFFDQMNRLEKSMQTISEVGSLQGEIITEQYENILTFLENSSIALANDSLPENKPTVWVPSNYSQELHVAASAKGRVHLLTEPSPVAIMKLTKNLTEAQGMRNCHIRDGTALVRLLHHLERLFDTGSETLSEDEVAALSDSFRAQEEHFIAPSFAAISSAGPNAAIIHYKPKKGEDRQVTDKEIFLLDSGGQYLDGTTDITRTVHFGVPTKEEKQAFTRVLKGQIALARTVFPQGIKGNVLDVMARYPLWQQGLDYAHGTGHGVGHQLNVHEGPIGISWRAMPDDPGLGPGMFLSNEPGYYVDNKYGVRIEDVIEIVTARAPGSGFGARIDGQPGEIGDFAGRGALAFNTVSLAPIQLKMIDISLLTDEEIQHLDKYHGRVSDVVGSYLTSKGFVDVAEWLAKETIPLYQYYATTKD